MQAENNKNMNIKIVAMGCRLNTLEAQKIQRMLAPAINAAIVVNTCAVTAEAERQSGQTIRRIARENPNIPIFVTGCAATRNPDMFAQIPNVRIIPNADKMKLQIYLDAVAGMSPVLSEISDIPGGEHLSKRFVQIQNGCNHDCTYCVTRLLRGRAVSFPYTDILADIRAAVADGFYEIVLTGVDIASYAGIGPDGTAFPISNLCEQILKDVPEVRRLRLSSMDPASPQIGKIIDLMRRDERMMRHMHLSMQSGCDKILNDMRRRHTGAHIRELIAAADGVTFSADIICGFPGETDELFTQTLNLIKETGIMRVHAFPFSPRPGTVAADMPNQVDRNISKQRVRLITAAADENRLAYMRTQLGRRVQVLVEQDNIARTPDDIPVTLVGCAVAPRTICDVEITDISPLHFIGKVC